MLSLLIKLYKKHWVIWIIRTFDLVLTNLFNKYSPLIMTTIKRLWQDNLIKKLWKDQNSNIYLIRTEVTNIGANIKFNKIIVPTSKRKNHITGKCKVLLWPKWLKFGNHHVVGKQFNHDKLKANYSNNQ